MINTKKLIIDEFIFTIKKWKVEERGSKFYNYQLEHKGILLHEQNKIIYNMKQIREIIKDNLDKLRIYKNCKKRGWDLKDVETDLINKKFIGVEK